MWKGLEHEPEELSEEGRNFLNDFSEVSAEARRLFIKLGFLKRGTTKIMDLYEVKRKSDISDNDKLNDLLDELSPQFIRYPVPLKDKLNMLRVKDIKPILEEKDLKKSGRKNELIDRLYKNVDDNELRTYLPSEAKEEMVGNTKCLSKNDRQVIDYRTKKIDLFLHSIRSLSTNNSQLEKMKSEDYVEEIEIIKTDNCPVCENPSDKLSLSKATRDKIPPYHPGCRCSMTPSSFGGQSASKITVEVDPEEVGKKDQSSGCLFSVFELFGFF
jgi:hypothetical protein